MVASGKGDARTNTAVTVSPEQIVVVLTVPVASLAPLGTVAGKLHFDRRGIGPAGVGCDGGAASER